MDTWRVLSLFTRFTCNDLPSVSVIGCSTAICIFISTEHYIKYANKYTHSAVAFSSSDLIYTKFRVLFDFLYNIFGASSAIRGYFHRAYLFLPHLRRFFFKYHLLPSSCPYNVSVDHDRVHHAS